MKRYLQVFALIFTITILSSCEKSTGKQADCDPDRTTVRVLNEKKLTVIFSVDYYYMVEENTIDTKLIPCNLPKEFQVDGMVVKVSGNVKAIPETANSPCCSDGLEITNILAENP